MKLLLDTCTFLWIVAGAPELSDRARIAFTAPDNEVFLSAVSAWEIAVKNDLRSRSKTILVACPCRPLPRTSFPR